MSYTRVNWQNAPSTATPVNAENLNTMDKGIADAHSQLVEIAKRIRNPKDYGAKGNANFFNELDGNWYEDEAYTTPANDDYMAIQSAIDSLNLNVLAVKGGSIHLDEGGFLCSKPLRVPNYVNIFGSGRYSTKIIRTGHTSSDVLTYNSENIDAIVHIVGGDGNTATQTAYGIGLFDLTLKGSETDLTSMTNYGIYAHQIAMSAIRNVDIEYANTSVFTQSYIWDSNIEMVRANICHTGFEISAATSLFMQGCYASSYRDYGYKLNNWLYSHISNCACDGGGNRNYWTDTTILATAYKFRNFKGVTVSSCGAEATNGTVLHLETCEGVTIDSMNSLGMYSDYTGTATGNIVCAYRISGGKNIKISNSKFTFANPAYTGVESANSSHYNRYVNGITVGLSIVDTEIENGVWLESGATANSMNLSSRWLLGNVTSANSIIYVDYVNGNDSSGNGTSETPYKTINKALSTLPRIIDHEITIQLKDADYLENPLIEGFQGKGEIKIQGNATDVSKTRIKGTSLTPTVVKRNTCLVTFKYLGLYCNSNNGKSISIIDNAGIVEVLNSTIDSWSGIFTGTIGIYTERSSFVLSSNNGGSTCATALNATLGSTIVKNGTQPTGTTNDELISSGGLIR